MVIYIEVLLLSLFLMLQSTTTTTTTIATTTSTTTTTTTAAATAATTTTTTTTTQKISFCNFCFVFMATLVTLPFGLLIRLILSGNLVNLHQFT